MKKKEELSSEAENDEATAKAGPLDIKYRLTLQEMMLGSKVYLDLWVKVRKDWRTRDAILKSLGFGQD